MALDRDAAGGRLDFNPGPLEAVERRDNVTGIAAVIVDLKKRTREDRLRVWVALGGKEEDFDG